MSMLLDTHVLLWWLDDNPALSKKGREAIADPAHMVVLCAAVIWEMRIKQALGKLKIAQGFFDVIKQQGFELLPITAEHAYAVGDLPNYHRDPFDRILIAQAKLAGLTIITHDGIFKKYPVSVLEV